MCDNRENDLSELAVQQAPGRKGRVRRAPLLLAAAILALPASLAMAQQVQVNKSFSPAKVALGGTSTVTVTLQNSSTTSAASIYNFKDDIASMTGSATLLGTTPTTTCGGTPTISGTAVIMSNGSIPIAPNATTVGSCTITFYVQGAVLGNGYNTIKATDVSTSNGAPPDDVLQTLQVTGNPISVSTANGANVAVGYTSTVTYTIKNNNSVALTNVAFPITTNAAATYSITGTGGTCVGTASPVSPQSASGSGTNWTASTSFSGITLAAGASCTVTLSLTSSTVQTVNSGLAVNTITDDQSVTNTTAGSASAKFISAAPSVSKTFSPTNVVPGGTTTVTVKITDVTGQGLTNVQFTDALTTMVGIGTTSPTVLATPTTSGCGSPTFTGVSGTTLGMSGGTIIAGTPVCTVTFQIAIPSTATAGTATNTIYGGNVSATTAGNASVNGASNATATLNVVTGGAGNIGGIAATKAMSPSSAGYGSPIKVTLNYTGTGIAGVTNSGNFNSGSVTDTFPTLPVSMVGYVDATHPVGFSGCGNNAVASSYATLATSFSASGLAVTSGNTCTITFYVQFNSVTTTSRTVTNTADGATFTSAVDGTTKYVTNQPLANITALPAYSVTNYVANASGLTGVPLAVSAAVNIPTGLTDTNVVVTIPLNAGKVQLAPNGATPGSIAFIGCPANPAPAITYGTNNESFTVDFGSANMGPGCTINYNVINEPGFTGSATPGSPSYQSATMTTAYTSTATNSASFVAPSPITVTKAFAPNQIQAGGTSTVSVTLSIPQAGNLATTTATGVTFADVLPSGVSFSPNLNFTATGCGTPASPSIGTDASSGNPKITFSNITLTTTAATPTSCTVTFDMTSNVLGAPLNIIPALAVTSDAGASSSNTQAAQASLTVQSGLGVQKTFVDSTLALGGVQVDYMRLVITNSVSTNQLTDGTLTDGMPANLVLASTTLGPVQSGETACGTPAITSAVGDSNVVIGNLTVPGGSATNPSQCVIYAAVKASSSATAGAVTNTIPANGLSFQGGYSNRSPASGTVTLIAAPTLTSTISVPSAVGPGETGAQVSVTCQNTSTTATATNVSCTAAGVATGGTDAGTLGAPTCTDNSTSTTVTNGEETLAPNASMTCVYPYTGPDASTAGGGVATTTSITFTPSSQSDQTAATPGTPATTVVVDAVNDNMGTYGSVAGGTSTSSVLNNDTVGGVAATLGSNVTLTTTGTGLGLTTAPASGSITMNASGQIVVAPGTTPGTYYYTYEICATPAPASPNPPACDTAVATVVVQDTTTTLGVTVSVPPTVTPGATVPGTIKCTNSGTNPATNVGCTPTVTVGAGTIVSGSVSCIPSSGSSVAANASMTCTFEYTAPGTAGGAPQDQPIPTTVTGTATSSAAPNGATATTTSNVILATNDNTTTEPTTWPASIGSVAGGSTPSVLSNDTVNGVPATTSNVTLTTSGTAYDGKTALGLNTTPAAGNITMNPDGTIAVAAGTTPGTYLYTYQICTSPATTPASCDTAVATVVVQDTSTTLGATVTVPATVSPGSTVTGTAQCTNNGANSATDVTCVVTASGGVAVTMGTCTPTSGSTVDVNASMTCSFTYTAPGTAGGASQTQTPATTLTVTATSGSAPTATGTGTSNVILATNDNFGSYSSATGGTTSSVLGNDTVNGQPATTSNVTLTTNGAQTCSIPMSGAGAVTRVMSSVSHAAAASDATCPTPLTLNADGTITVPAGATPGTYQVPYQICANPAVTPAACDTAVATVVVTASISAPPQSGTGVVGTVSTPITNVLTGAMINGQPATVGSSGNATVTPTGTWPGGITLNTATGAIEYNGQTPAGTYQVQFTLCDKSSPPNCVTVTDTVTIKAQQTMPVATPINARWMLGLMALMFAMLALTQTRKRLR
jgi:hypothetical protein